ncbi:MAG: acetyl-CoA carboxylase biotin carboxyl carrier protein [Sphaerochaeta sp.]|jgi:acetyl-CoA carboxylase biotin carboxyl carrier protein|nr:acetyl-CoA carboxylase biotin carboxyl carrier protein [Spirochaetales bacterium]
MKTIETMELDQLIHLFEESSLTELELSCDQYTIKMKREGEGATALERPKRQAVQPREEDTEQTEVITSPIVGTFYLTPAPDAPPYVGVGSTVAEGDVLCTIEAMKLMNQLEADYPCEIVRILAKPEQMVEFGSPLFEVKRV